MDILVTGGAGFIGSHIVDKLISLGHNVMVLDNFSTGNKKFLNSKAKIIVVDIKDFENISKAFEDFRPQTVFHLAAMIDLRESLENPEKSHEVNVTGSINIIKASQASGVKKIIFSSSAAVYGDNKNFPIKETEPTKSSSPYGDQKAEIEIALKNSGIASTILRYSNVYGPRQGTVGEGGVIAIFCKRIKDSKGFRIFGTGTQTRDYVYVDDIVDANIKSLGFDKNYCVYNVSTGIETSVLELGEKLLTISGKNVKVEHTQALQGEVLRSVLDNSLIKSNLSWKPTISIIDGLKKTWDWFS
jgi:UDP-glucose 4-epimerase